MNSRGSCANARPLTVLIVTHDLEEAIYPAIGVLACRPIPAGRPILARMIDVRIESPQRNKSSRPRNTRVLRLRPQAVSRSRAGHD